MDGIQKNKKWIFKGVYIMNKKYFIHYLYFFTFVLWVLDTIIIGTHFNLLVYNWIEANVILKTTVTTLTLMVITLSIYIIIFNLSGVKNAIS